MNKLEFSSLIDCFVWFAETETIRGGGDDFLSGLLSFDAFLTVVSFGKKCIYIEINCNERTINATFKGKLRDNVNKAKTSPTFICCL